ncbi:MAG: tRNA uridine-5-carboxymethylaminomethyl(34) synthesis enzyme MnmG [Candidatus Caenarcaniphilales bacterium]|nr:tRNA uridine-5-carboxymethylaminomethyl(34) synthesis enzyme MnmG [Candidatus Caenarcaniphilales bacterium]
MQAKFDIVVIGGGHAGSEAAHAAAKLGLKTLLLTNNIDQIASMPCNPAIGGPGKSQLVKEIDALGGIMGLAADATYLQMKTLNSSKGPATRSLRAQSDKKQYSAWVRQYLENLPNLTLYQSSAKAILFDEQNSHKVIGVETSLDEQILADAVILTAGTFLEGRTFTGHKFESSGRAGEKPSLGLSPQISSLGLTTGRLKTGTPPRIDRKTIDFSKLELAPGDESLNFFSFLPHRPIRRQYPCHITRTNANTHEVIMNNLDKSPMYSGAIDANGPRYCPSIEDKVVRFPHNPSHHFFLEPEGLDTNEIYLQGCSTSLPIDVQWQIVKSLPGLENAWITRPAYAVEYDYFPGIQFKHSFEAKDIDSLFVAGQVLGTSGYEEAASQGLMAGINAAIKVSQNKSSSELKSIKLPSQFKSYIQEQDAFILGRESSYIGTLVDDLVTKEINDPYRMMTSRSEYRLILRQDNADQRLTPLGYELGLVDDYRWNIYENKQKRMDKELKFASNAKFSGDNVPKDLDIKGSNRITLEDLLKKQGFTWEDLQNINFEEALAEDDIRRLKRDQKFLKKIEYPFELETHIKYQGYIDRQMLQIRDMQKRENIKIPEGFDFKNCEILSLEARDKLDRVKPLTIGQASRVGGISPSDITSLLISLEAKKKAKVTA